MRWVLPFLTLIIPFLTGCSIPRAAAINVSVRQEIPAPNNAQRNHVAVSGLILPFQNPSGSISFVCAMRGEETIAWYADALTKRGWTLTHGTQKQWNPPTAPTASNDKYQATRIRWQLGNLILLRENLTADFSFDSKNSPDTCFATFTLDEDSLFDKPAQSFQKTFLPPFGKVDTDTRLVTLYYLIYVYALF